MKTKLLLLIVLLFVFNIANLYSKLEGQNLIDSLLKQVEFIKEDTSGVVLLLRISFNYQNTDPKKGLNYGFRALVLAKKISWQKGLAESYNTIGTNYMSLYDNDMAEESFRKSLDINRKINYQSGIASNLSNLASIQIRRQELDSAMSLLMSSLEINEQINNKVNIAANLRSIGNIYMRRSDFSKALEFLMNALKINEEIGRKSGIASNLQDIGIIYANLKNFDKAIEYYEKAKEINKETGNLRDLANNINNIGTTYFRLEKYTKALEYFLQSLQINLSIANRRSIANNYGNIAETYKFLSDYDKALQHYEKALEINEPENDKKAMAANYAGLSDLYLLMASDSIINISNNKQNLIANRIHNLNRSHTYLEKAIKIYEEASDLLKLSQMYQKLSKAYEIKGDNTNALIAFKQYTTLHDSVFSLDRYRIITEIETKHYREMKDKEIIQLKLAQKFEKLRTSILFGSIIILMALLIIGFLRFREKKLTNIILRRQNSEITLQKRLLEEQNNHIYSSIRYASTIQNAILPWENTLKNAFKEHFVLFKPKDIVSGDCYWFQQIDGVKYLAVIDCTGHGVPGAMLAVIASSALDDAVLSKRLSDTAQILSHINLKVTEVLHQRLTENKMKDGMELGLVAIHKNKLQFSGAGRPLYLLNNELAVFKTDRRGIAGSKNNLEYRFHSIEFELSNIKAIYLTTDGFADQMNEHGKKYGTTRFHETLAVISSEPFDVQLNLLSLELERHQGNREQIDDIAILGIRL